MKVTKLFYLGAAFLAGFCILIGASWGAMAALTLGVVFVAGGIRHDDA
jgi:hypothetical protein